MKPGKKGFALLLDAGPAKKKKPNDASTLPPDQGDHAEPDGDEDDLSDIDDMMGSDDDLPDDDQDPSGAGDAAAADPFADDSDGDASKIDPEAAALATRLGIHEPKKQQALIDLIQLVTGPGFGGGSSTPPPAPSLPESTY